MLVALFRLIESQLAPLEFLGLEGPVRTAVHILKLDGGLTKIVRPVVFKPFLLEMPLGV